MRIRKVQTKKDKGTKLYIKLKPFKRNMYRQYLVIVTVWIARFTTFCLAAFWTAGTHAHA